MLHRESEVSGMLTAVLEALTRLVMVLALGAGSARAQAPEQWVEWGDRIHGGFGSLVALGIRIGLDASQRLGAQRRELIVDYTDGPNTPCACVVDGIAIAVSASLGQRTLRLAHARTEEGLLARVVFTHRSHGGSLSYEIPYEVLGLMQDINREEQAAGRFRAVMSIDPARLFRLAGNAGRN